MSTGSKPVTTIGIPILGGERLVLARAHDGAHVTRSEEALHPIVRSDRIAASPAARARARRAALKFGSPASTGERHGHRVRGRRRLEADREEDDLLRLGFLARSSSASSGE